MEIRYTSAVTAFLFAAMAPVVIQQPSVARQGRATPASVEASILLYHRFRPVGHDEMTVRTATFRAQLDYLKQHGYQIVPLRTVVSHLLGKGPAPPARSVVITVDDELIAAARQSGYVAGFTLDRRPVTPHERILALPRYLVLDSDSGRRFASMLPADVTSR
jgi:hypothetical protein